MTDMADTTDPIRRDTWGRPMIVPPGGGREVPYQRCTTFVDVLDDKWALQKWQQRMVAVGLASRPDLHAAASSWAGDPDAHKKALDTLCDQAREAAAASSKATLGTALHTFTETLDRTGDVAHVPDRFAPHIDAYKRVTDGWEHVHIEQFTVLDEFGVAGTPDRVARLPGHDHLTVADIKGLALDTPLPTPSGWTTMGEVAVGDEVFDSEGRPCRVTVKSGAKRIGTHVVVFDDGTEIVCDTEHIWWTAPGVQCGVDPAPRGIAEIIDTLRLYGQSHHRVPVAGPLDLPARDLPIDPYILGCWIGDGAARSGEITKEDALFAILEADGAKLGKRQTDSRNPAVVTRSVIGLTASLKRAGLQYNKHIPPDYLRASQQQRLRLLQGLCDTDGTWNTARRSAVFYSCDKRLAMDFEELALSLGQRPNLAEYTAHGFGKDVTVYRVEFTPVGINPFRLPRKADQAAASTKPVTWAQRRVITDVRPGPDVETACIGVSSPNHTYLCGRRMVPTHNTGASTLKYGMGKTAMQMAVYAHSLAYTPSGGRRPLGDVDLARGLVVALDADAGTCEAVWVDIAAGWEACALARQVWAWRKRRWPLDDTWEPQPPPVMPDDLLIKARNAPDIDTLTALWRDHRDEWRPEHTAAATARKRELT